MAVYVAFTVSSIIILYIDVPAFASHDQSIIAFVL